MSTPPDREKLKEYAKGVFGALGGAMTSAMIYAGDRMGLYRALAGAGPLSAAELAARTGLSERWLREWLHQQGAAGILEYRGDDCFALSAEGEAVLADESHPACGIGFFGHLPQMIAIAERLPECFASGLGLPYDAFGPEGARGIERGIAPWFRALLVPLALPRVPGVVDRLREGARASAAAPASPCSSWRRPSRAPSSTATTSPGTRWRARRRTARMPERATRASTTPRPSRCPRTAASRSSPASTAFTT